MGERCEQAGDLDNARRAYTRVRDLDPQGASGSAAAAALTRLGG